MSLNIRVVLPPNLKNSYLQNEIINDGETEEVEFCKIKMSNGEIVEESIIKVDIKEVEKNDYSLFVNKYNIIINVFLYLIIPIMVINYFLLFKDNRYKILIKEYSKSYSKKFFAWYFLLGFAFLFAIFGSGGNALNRVRFTW